ncbi:MAG TPA: prepilin peptidase [Acidobacteriota bacterium]|nr:prepilin peptidase [Acidobacteriota bacterium]
MSASGTVSIIIWVTVVALGLAVGSFTNVLIYRLPRRESLWRPRSRCPACGNALRWYHNIPVVSWVILRGRCAFCRAAISWVYPLVELLTAGLFAAFFARYGISVVTLGFWYLSVTLVAVFFIDLRHRIIPNTLTYPGVVVGVALAMVSSHLSWSQSLLGAAAGLGIFIGMAYFGRLVFRKDSMGGGDVKLAAVLGAFLGVGKLLVILVLSAAIGLVISLVGLWASPELRRDRTIPYGPFLALAAVVVCFFGESLITYYVRHFLH